MTNDEWMTRLECPPQHHPERSEALSSDPLELPLSFRRRDWKPRLAACCGCVAASTSLGM